MANARKTTKRPKAAARRAAKPAARPPAAKSKGVRRDAMAKMGGAS